ncbi:extracellular solute-binding protein [Leucobacter sp. gxy201]|uniref:ABC transporter substrate-binding protein n=1 Tax=Leucobacter sp. gxy201 TaxID=2957200 RepID=UPI003DA151CE
MKSTDISVRSASGLAGIEIGRRGLLQAGGIGAMLALLSGCVPAGGGRPSDSLTFTSWTFAGRSVGPVQAAAELYTRQTGVSVETKVYPFDRYLNQLVLAARGGRMTGIVHIDEEFMSTLATAEVIRPLDRVIDESLYPEFVRSAGMYRGTRFGMPWTQSAIGMVTNTELLSQLGADATAVRSIDDFTDLLRQIKRSDGSIIPYAPCTDVVQLKDFIPWVWAFGGDIYDGSRVTLGDDPSRQALDYWKMLLDEGLIQAGVDRDSARTLFAQGRVPIYDDAPQAYGIVPSMSTDPDLQRKMSCMPRPAVRGAGANLVWSQPLVALDDSARTTEALRFFSTDEAALRVIFEGQGAPPITLAALGAPWFAGIDFQSRWTETIASNARRNPLWEFPIATSAQRVLNEAVEQGLRGSLSTEHTLKECREALSELLEVRAD